MSEEVQVAPGGLTIHRHHCIFSFMMQKELASVFALFVYMQVCGLMWIWGRVLLQ